MKTTIRFTNMTKKTILPLVVSGMMCVTGAYAQSGDIIGFYSPSASSTFVTPGTTVEFTIRLSGTIVVSNLVAAPFAMPTIRMEVGSEGSSSTAYATLVRTSWTDAPLSLLNRTDLTFAYTIRPSDMANPLKIYGTSLSGFTILQNQCEIYKANVGGSRGNITWKVNFSLYDQPGSNGIDSERGVSLGDFDLSSQNICLRTLSFDVLNSPATLIARQRATTWRITSGATNMMPVKVMVWTPQTNVLQIGSIPGQAWEVTIPAGADYADFAVKGLDTNAIPTLATVYAQRPSDYAKNGTAVMNYISRAVTIEPAGPPTISIEFPNGRDTQTLSETTEFATGSFRIVLSEADTSRVYVSFAVDHQPRTLTNIVITPQPGGYYVNAGQEMSDWYTFSVKDGTRDSSRSPYVRINASATNTAKYAVSSAGNLNIANVAPCVLWYPPSIGDENMPVTFEWDELIDADADMAKGITFKWNFGDGASVTQTNYTTLGSITHTYYDVGDTPKTYTVTLMILDADRGSYTLPTHTITISPPPPPNVSVVVNRADGIYQEGDMTATYKVILSEPALQNTIVSLKGQYLVDATSSDDCLTLMVTNNIFIATGLTSSVPYTMTMKDGTAKTANGIQLIPTITNVIAKAQYPGTYSGYITIQNVAPGIDANPTCLPTATPVSPYDAIEMNNPFIFKYTATDVNADKAGAPPISVEFQFEDGFTTSVMGATGSVTKTFTSLGVQTVTMIARDKDGGETTLAFPIQVIVPLPTPSVTVVDYPDVVAENDTGLKQLTVMLSQTPASAGIMQSVTVYLDVTPTDSALNGTVIIPTNLTFSLSQTTTTVSFSVQDGTSLSASAGFTITPRIVAGAPGSAVYKQFQPGLVLVQNVAPVLLLPIDGSSNTLAGVGQPCTFNWSVKDVAADLPGMTLAWDWGDGTTTTTIGGSGTTNHTYQIASPQIVVTVTATDKDGDFAITSFYVTVANLPKYLTVNQGKGSGWYLEGATAIVSADADPMYKEFAEWTGTASDYASNRYMRATTVTAPAFPTTLTATYRDSVARTLGCWGRGFTMDGAAGGVSTDENAGAPSGTAAVKLGGVGVVQDNGFVAFKTVVKGSGTISLQAGVVQDNGFVAFETVVPGSGMISFWWKVSSQMNADYLKFKIDGIEANAISGTDGSWAQVTCRVEGIGDHTLRWEYVKDGSVSVGKDAGWVDDIVWVGDTQTPALAPVIVLATLTNQTMAIQFTGERGITYFVQTNGMLNPVGWGDYQSIEPIWVNESNGVHRFEVAPPASGPDILFYRIVTP